MQRFIFFFMVIFSVTGLFSCKKLDKLTQFNLKYNTDVTIKSTVGINVPIDLYTPKITTNSETELSANNTHKNLVEVIKLKELKLKIKTPAGQDFDFLNSIEIYIKTDNLPEKKIAWNTDIPENGLTEVVLDTSDNDLKDYILGDSFQLRTKTTTDHLITQDIDVEINAVFWVDAKILGL
ncbi:MAG: hypothetical protein J7K46_09865 [Bacteroidales bacterium]|nr:hypothetical protein [Bacteroidales bacterium]